LALSSTPDSIPTAYFTQVKTCLLDSSFLIDLLNEISVGEAGLAHGWLRRNASAELWISSVTLAEVLEGTGDSEAVNAP
jgi:predicted nucleic acid-binding protein